MFAAGESVPKIAAELEVSLKSAYAWRRAWKAGGEEALASKGPSGPDRVLSEELVAKLVVTLQEGPAAAGWDEDQVWTLARVRTLIGRMFHKTVGLTTVWEILHRAGFTPQQPIARAVQRDEDAITHWKRHQWPAAKGSRAGRARGSVSPMRPASR